MFKNRDVVFYENVEALLKRIALALERIADKEENGEIGW